VETRKFIHQSLTLILAAMLLMVVGIRSWGMDQVSFTQVITKVEAGCLQDKSLQAQGNPVDQNESKISVLALDAVITPVLSFDFSHYFYFVPEVISYFAVQDVSAYTAITETFFQYASFFRIFATYIVTNAP
jgi:hypothetical protein